MKDLKSGQKDFSLLIKGFDTEAGVIDNDGDRLLVHTNADAPNYKVVSIDPKNPDKRKLGNYHTNQNKIVTGCWHMQAENYSLHTLEDASSRVYQTNYKGTLEREIKLPGIGSAGGFDGHREDKELFYTYSSFDYPPAIFKYNIATGKTELFRKNEVKVNTDNYQTVQTFFTSKDGAKVPMFITYKKGIKLDGNNPTLIYGYGGFNIPMTPGFSISNAFFIEQGGVYVVVNMRGGNEYGEDWHKGRHAAKQATCI